MNRIVRLAAAYLLTTVASGLIVSFTISLNRFWNLWQRGLATPGDLFTDAPLVCLLVTAYAFFPALLAILIAERRHIRGPAYFCAIAAALGLTLPALALGRHAELSLSLFGLALGPLAGWVFWRLAWR